MNICGVWFRKKLHECRILIILLIFIIVQAILFGFGI